MSLARSDGRLRLPETLRAQLLGFRRRVWWVKLAEALAASAFGAAVGFLLMFGVDRLGETPAWARAALFAATALGFANVGLAAYRWVWRHRHPDQLARLLGRKLPSLGDQLLGVIELAENDQEQSRSRALCEAAIAQVAADAGRRDLRAATPTPRHRVWAAAAALPLAATVGLLAAYPEASRNAWARLLTPWRAVTRYNFAALGPLPSRLVVAHGEPFRVRPALTPGSIWKPESGLASLDGQRPVSAPLRDGGYGFDLPPQLELGTLSLRVGDARRRIRIEPKARPELRAVMAEVALPAYLGRPQVEHKDVRGGAVALVKGSRATFAATASRDLSAAVIGGRPRTPVGPTVASAETLVDVPVSLEFRWQDAYGLAGREPFVLAVTPRDDEAPSLSVDDMPRQKVLLDTEVLNFKVHARDDFGVRKVGLEWRGVGDASAAVAAAQGERVLGAGGPEADALDVDGTFSAKALGIEPQPVAVRAYAEDYLPGRPRAYSPASTFYVLNAGQHAIWLAEQLSKWHRQSLEVRDREMLLHEANKQIRALPADELDRPETRKRVEAQAAAERANGRRLTNLVVGGEDLVRQAMRNPEIGVGHLEKWAEMLQIMKDIAGNRMPSVADLLKQAAQAPVALASADPPKPSGPVAGQNRATPGGGQPPADDPAAKKADAKAVPTVVDRESSMLTSKPGDPPPPLPSTPGNPRLLLPTTTLAGGKPKPGDPAPACPAAPAVEEAVNQQRDLLAEFDKIADELNKVLANLEGSTLVKRLKAASRGQTAVAVQLNGVVRDTFGVAQANFGDAPPKLLDELAGREAKGSQTVSTIMDDLHSYFERRRQMTFKSVLDEMRKDDVIGGLRQLGDDLKARTGVSIAECEFWSDRLDCWAEDLVDPASGGT